MDNPTSVHVIPENTSEKPHHQSAGCWCNPQYVYGPGPLDATWLHRGQLLTGDLKHDKDVLND
jgi:hypothetical protein